MIRGRKKKLLLFEREQLLSSELSEHGRSFICSYNIFIIIQELCAGHNSNQQLTKALKTQDLHVFVVPLPLTIDDPHAC